MTKDIINIAVNKKSIDNFMYKFLRIGFSVCGLITGVIAIGTIIFGSMTNSLIWLLITAVIALIISHMTTHKLIEDNIK